jgi:hypothetical protein
VEKLARNWWTSLSRNDSQTSQNRASTSEIAGITAAAAASSPSSSSAGSANGNCDRYT